MTAILRIVSVTINSSSSIDVAFTEVLTTNLITANASILSQTANVPDSQVLKVTVSGNVLSITCQPLTPFSAYFLKFQSTPSNPFISTNGNAKISEDNVSNKYLITGPIQADNPVQNYLQSFFQNNIYDTTDPNTIVSKYLQSISINFARALYDIKQVKNENYLSFVVTDELHNRGDGPFDRLYEEAAYDVFRVGFGPTKGAVNTSFIFTEFPSYPVTLQRQFATEAIKPSSNDSAGTFNINTLTFNLGSSPVTRVDSIIFTLTTGNAIYTYDIQKLGYQILDSRYDQDFASSYLLLTNNQVKISEAILQDPNFSLDQIFSISVRYEYKGLGIEVDSSTVSVYTTLPSTREVLPPIINIFSLQHSPITDANNNTPVTGGVIFTDPNSNTGSRHPAFLTEIPFSLSALPSSPGIYSIDYATGTVYVFGADSLNDGTGPSPPLATYHYKFNYVSETDYVYDSDLLDVVALPLGNLINAAGTINFNYEQVLIPGVDYVADVHIESINERVANGLDALNTLTTQNSPITNVFQIYNETSGEIYLLDRWNDNKVYFRYNKPPRVLQQVGEKASFYTVTNELLGINTTTTNVHGKKIFIVYLANNTIIGSTQDSIGSSINTSLVFTNGNVFSSEIWYNQFVDAATNMNRLLAVGEYVVDYKNGIVYVAVSTTQDNDIGTATYKKDSIVPNSPHIISVDDIYYRISVLNPKNKQFSYTSFSDVAIIPAGLEVSDETFLNGTSTSPYQIYNGTIGAFVGASFVSGVSSEVKFVRSVYEYNDLVGNTNPINFANVSTSSNFNVNVGVINKQSFETVQFDGVNYFITLNENIPYISPGITYTFSLVRVSDSQSLWNNSGTIVPGNPLKLILPGIGAPLVGDLVNVNYSFAISQFERVVIDYNKGDLFADYTYVADEIVVSYEYGDNAIDFRKNRNLPPGTNYYVSYKVGALRDGLLRNFGTLVNVPDLATFDLTLTRERYRDALQASLSSFIQGPTVAALKNLVQIITHIEPQLIESAFQAWSLGSGLLFPTGIQTSGSFQLLPAHFGNGVLIDRPGQTITTPINSNLRLEEGTFETWVLPQWNGLDNDAALTFSITRDGYAIEPYRVFVGGSEYHPTITNGSFSLNKDSRVIGRPNTNKDGVFIYYTDDASGNFQRWFLEIIDGYVATPNTHTYKFQITSTGKFYDVKSLSAIKPANMSTFTGTNKVSMTITPRIDGYGVDEGITFISDLEHYILDFGLAKDQSRLSIFKDVSGYLNFRVYDKNRKMYMVSTDVSAWRANAPHMVAASWKLNTRNNRDEMHLFVDGLEVPNIIKYGQKLLPFPHEKFRTVDPEEIIGLSNRDIVGSIDLVTTSGSPIVSSSINFSAYNIFIGDTIFIDEIGFSTAGYTISAISGQTLILSSPMPSTLTNAKFSVNRTSYIVKSDINVVPNIAVATIHVDGYVTDGYGTIGSNILSSFAANFINEGVKTGYLVSIGASIHTVVSILDAKNLLIDNTFAATFSGTPFHIYSNVEHEIPGVRALNPAYSISKDANFNDVLTISNDVLANDLILIRMLGINFTDVKKQYYVWSDGYENVLMTQLPAPISLDQTSIKKVILPTTAIGPAEKFITGPQPASILLTDVSPIVWTAGVPDGYVYQPINSVVGRLLDVTIAGNNTNFGVPVQVTINGLPASETISFTDYGTKGTVNLFTHVNSVEVIATPVNATKNTLTVNVKETNTITHNDGYDGYAPVIRYSYHIGGGYHLQNDGAFVRDGYYLFSSLDIDNYLVIYSPVSAAGYYKITGLSADRHAVSIQATSTSLPVPLPNFIDGIYQVLNVNAYRSGLQNGFFTLEEKYLPGTPYLMNKGFYELNYSTYASIKFDSLNGKMFMGSDFLGVNQANSVLDHATIYSVMLSDTRVGEVIASNLRSVTKDYNSLKATKPNSNTLALIGFDSFPFTNSASFYASTNNDHKHFQSSWAVNDNFDQSIVVLDKPVLVPNDGILDTRKQGTIEFWMSPIFDTSNDPNTRFYFDAFGAIVEEVVSVSNVAVKVSTPASKILKVTLAAGDPRIDYFAGGSLEIDTQHAMQEESISLGTNTVIVAQPILQVITVKIVGDFTEKDYFAGGSVSSDAKTIYLGTALPAPNLNLIITYQSSINQNVNMNTQVIRLNKKLPAQNSKVIVTYIPSGLQGDRISIFKDQYGYINFGISASGTDYIVRAPTLWAKNTWHRVKASYKINGGLGNDEMRLFLDGYQYTDVTFGTDLVFGQFPMVMGSVNVGDGYTLISSITFKDPINDLFIGTDYIGANPIYCLLDNFRISNLSRPVYAPYGEPIDVNYSNNLSTVFPVTQDLYTTYLMNFDTMVALNNNFATLVNRSTGAFDFTLNIFDSFGIVSGSAKVKEVLENLINILKPANSRVFIKYII